MAWYFSPILRLPPLDVRNSSPSGHVVEIDTVDKAQLKLASSATLTAL